MTDCNTTTMALEIATNKLNWYIGLSIFASLISIVAIVVSIIVNKRQLKANHDWNRRSFTSQQIKDFITKLSSIRDELDILTNESKQVIEYEGKYINFTDRLLLHKPITSDEVHKWVCKKDVTNESGYEKTSVGDNKPCKTTKDGEKIVNYLLEFISIYEQIAVGLLNKVYDEKIIADTLKHPIKRNYEFYKEYIEHRRDKHKAVNFGESFKQMYIKFWTDELTGDKRGRTEG